MTPRTGSSPSYGTRPGWGRVTTVTPAPQADHCMWFGKGATCDINAELVIQPLVDLRGNQLWLLEMQKVSDAVDDLERGTVNRKVRAEVAEQVSADRAVVRAVQIQRRHRWRLHGGRGFGFRVRVGELRIERSPIRPNDVRDVIGSHVAPQFGDVVGGVIAR